MFCVLFSANPYMNLSNFIWGADFLLMIHNLVQMDPLLVLAATQMKDDFIIHKRKKKYFTIILILKLNSIIFFEIFIFCVSSGFQIYFYLDVFLLIHISFSWSMYVGCIHDSNTLTRASCITALMFYLCIIYI